MRPALPISSAGSSLRFLYHTPIGRVFLKVLTRPFVSNIVGKYMESSLSKKRIKKFIRQNHIDLSVYQTEDWRSFNAFFSRHIKPEARPMGNPAAGELLSPADAKLLIYPIRDGLVLPIKESEYTVASLLQNEALAKRYQNGWAVVLRLCVDDYHRYCYAASGEKEPDVFVPGKLHTVQPIALRMRPVFCENARSYTILHTEQFGEVVQMEVGALMVGKIINHDADRKMTVTAGVEKGYFAFGGSTIVLLFGENTFEPDAELVENTRNDLETVVRFGEMIGKCISSPKNNI
ncbi:MAG: phosphatidylserine decarboxylase [Eubacteriales bacterium]